MYQKEKIYSFRTVLQKIIIVIKEELLEVHRPLLLFNTDIIESINSTCLSSIILQERSTVRSFTMVRVYVVKPLTSNIFIQRQILRLKEK